METRDENIDKREQIIKALLEQQPHLTREWLLQFQTEDIKDMLDQWLFTNKSQRKKMKMQNSTLVQKGICEVMHKIAHSQAYIEHHFSNRNHKCIIEVRIDKSVDRKAIKQNRDIKKKIFASLRKHIDVLRINREEEIKILQSMK